MRKHGRRGTTRKRKLKPLPVYLTIEDDPQMGLNNTKCLAPVAFCQSKRVYLSEDDIRLKCCMCKPTIDMIGLEKCKKLEYLERS